MEEEALGSLCMIVLLAIGLTTTALCWGQGQGNTVLSRVRRKRHCLPGTTMTLPNTSETLTTSHQLRQDRK